MVWPPSSCPLNCRRVQRGAFMPENLLSRPRSTASALKLAEDEVHVWHVRLGELVPDLCRLLTLLSRDEYDRSVRFHFEQNRTEFCLSRAVLRLMLESYG